MKYFWRVTALASILAAATLLWLQHTEMAFVIGTLGVVAWFLNYRQHLKQILQDRTETEIDNAQRNVDES